MITKLGMHNKHRSYQMMFSTCFISFKARVILHRNSRLISCFYLFISVYLLISVCISASYELKWVKWKLLSPIWLFVTLWTIQPMEFSRPEYWSGYRFPSPGDLPNPGIKPRSPRVQADSLAAEPQGKPFNQNQMAKVVYISPMTQLSWVHKNYITNPPTNPKSLYWAAFFSSHIPGQYFSCPKSLRARYQRIRDQPYCPEPTNIIQTSPKQFPCPALPFPQKTQ